MNRRDAPRRAAMVMATVLLVTTLTGLANTSTPLPGVQRLSMRERVLAELRISTAGTLVVGTSLGRSPGAGTVAAARVSMLGGSSGHPLGGRNATADEVIARASMLFGTGDRPPELRPVVPADGVLRDPSTIRYQQHISGVPVLAGELVVRVGTTGDVLSVAGELSDAQLSEDELAAAVAPPGDMPAELMVFDPALLGATVSLLDRSGPDRTSQARLVWRQDIDDRQGEVMTTLTDAHSGERVLEWDGSLHIENRRVCDNAGNASNPEACPTSGSLVARSEGGAATGNTDVDRAYDLSGVVYDFYATVLGRDSLDGAGLPLVSTVRYCLSPAAADCPYPGAYWNGSQMVYGAGFASADDVVGHEFAHGLTQYTSRLLPYGESGAIAESMSDVFGELMDQWSTVSGPDPVGDRWLIGEQALGGAVRNMADPTSFDDPDRMTSSRYAGTASDSHGIHTNAGVGDKAAYLIADGTGAAVGGVFNGQAIAGIGLVKTAKIFYEAQRALLGPGADYADLGLALPQACTNLRGLFGISANDCVQVSKAVRATEMDQPPTTPGARLTAPICDAGKVVTGTIFSDDMENAALTKWSRPTPANPAAAARWETYLGVATSGSRSLHAPNLAESARAEATIAASIQILSGTSTYLWFSHSYSMEADLVNAPATYVDGGVVEFSTNGGAAWSDAANLAGTVNGYPTGVTLSAGTNNPLGVRAAYSGTSPGFQQTRINLSPFAGTSIKVQFVAGTDGFAGGDGWFVDDVAIYTCAIPSAPDAPGEVSAVGGHQSAFITWTPPVFDGGAPITGYRITPYIGATALSAISTGSASPSFNVTGLANGTTYTFTVIATNSIGNGLASSSTNSVTPAPGVPYQPTAIGAIRGDHSATLAWTAPASNGGSTITAYVVTPYIGSTAQTPTITPTTSTTFNLAGLINGTAYTFRVAAVNSTGTGPPSLASAAVTPAGVPVAPTGVSAAAGHLAATLVWSPPSSANGTAVTAYVITPYRMPPVGAPIPQPSVTTPDAVTNAVVDGLLDGVVYTFTVAAVNAVGAGANSAASNAIVPDADLPGAPTGVSAVRGDQYAVVAWTAPVSNGGAAILSYVITPYIGAVALAPTVTTGSEPASTVAGLANGTAYTFRVNATNHVGTGASSTPSSPVIPAGLPVAPTAVAGTASDRSVSLTWTPPASNGATVINYVVTPYLGVTPLAPITTPNAIGAAQVTGLTNGLTYSFRVAATNSIGTGASSFASTGITPVGVPSPPVGVNGARGDGTVSLHWTEPADDGGRAVTNYVITPFVGGVARTPTITPTTSTTFGLTGLTNGTPYTFQLAAVNAVGTGELSSDIVVLTPAGSPGSPSSVGTLPGNGSMLVNWAPPASDGGAAISGYLITTFVNAVPIGSVDAPGNSLSIVVSGLDARVSYTFAVAAKNATGLGTPSPQTAAVQPSKPGFTAAGPDRVVDTRAGESPGALRQVAKVKVGGENVLQVRFTDLAGLVPASGVGAVSLNVAVTNTGSPGFVTVFPCGERKLVASVNYATGQTVANAVVAPVSANGSVCFYSLVPVDLIVDLNGWFAADSDFAAVGPDRVFDTRPGESPAALRQVDKSKVGGERVLEVKVTGLPGLVPAGNVTAVSLNVAVTGTSAPGFVTVYPCGGRKLVASVNYAPGQTVANAVIAPVSDRGTVCFFSLAPVDLIVDINGWFAGGSDFSAVGPDRIFDTRAGESPGALRQVDKLQIAGDKVLEVSVVGLAGLTPETDVGAVSMNVAVTNTSGPGFVTVYPCGERKLVASVNYTRGQTVANAVVAPVSARGTVCFYSLVAVDLIVDVNGWFPRAD